MERMKRFRIVALDYKIDPGFKGPLQATPECNMRIPKDFDSHPLICNYRLQIESEEGEKEFRFNITAEGRFEIPEEQREGVGKADRKVLLPIIQRMEKELMKTINEITAVFHIKPIQIELVTEE